MKQVFVDSHHQGLFSSLVVLFEKRLGWKLFTQAGLQWYEEKLWKVYDHPSTAEQYLLREVEKERGITREQFKQMDFDLILCSIPDHVEPFTRLAKEKNCPIIFQVGNQWLFDHDFPIKNILASARIPHLMGFNVCQYHQEFPLSLYNHEPPRKNKKIYCFINCINTLDLYREDWALFLQLEQLLTEFEFKSFGGQTRDGAIAPQEEVARLTKEADFIFHTKNQGDGYSYGMHTAAACGKTIITRLEDYKGKLAEDLISLETCIIVDGKTPQQIAGEIRYVWDLKLEEMSQKMANRFSEVVNFDAEQKMIEQFLDNLK